MHLIGRYEKIRAWALPADVISAPYILDRGRARTDPLLIPSPGDEWWKSPSGLWRQVKDIWRSETGGLSGGSTGAEQQLFIGFLINGPAVGVATFSLNSGYTAGSAGAAASGRMFLSVAKTISAIYFWINSFTGTASNVNDLNVEVRTESSTFRIPNTTAGGLLDSGVVNPASATGWTKVTLAGTALAAGSLSHLIVGDADGGATDFAVVSVGSTVTEATQAPTQGLYLSVSTTNGWGAITTQQRLAHIVALFSDGTARGDVFTTKVSPAVNTNRKGLYIGGVTAPLKIFGFAQGQSLNGNHSLELYDASTNPGGTVLATGTVSFGNSSEYGYWLTPYTLAKNTAYRIVLKASSGNVLGPGSRQHGALGTGASNADLNGGMLGGGAWYYAEANGTTNWSNDNVNIFPDCQLLIEDQIAPSAANAGAGGGGGSMINAGGGGGLIR